MIPELGHFVLWLALGVSLAIGIVPLVGAHQGRKDWMALARPATDVLFVLTLLPFLALVWAFVEHDFSVLYVAENSNSELPLQFRVAAVWGGH